MKCPHCGYVSFEFLDSCNKCSKDLSAHRAKYGFDQFVEPVAMALANYMGSGRAGAGKGRVDPFDSQEATDLESSGFSFGSDDYDEGAATEEAPGAVAASGFSFDDADEDQDFDLAASAASASAIDFDSDSDSVAEPDSAKSEFAIEAEEADEGALSSLDFDAEDAGSIEEGQGRPADSGFAAVDSSVEDDRQEQGDELSGLSGLDLMVEEDQIAIPGGASREQESVAEIDEPSEVAAEPMIEVEPELEMSAEPEPALVEAEPELEDAEVDLEIEAEPELEDAEVDLAIEAEPELEDAEVESGIAVDSSPSLELGADESSDSDDSAISADMSGIEVEDVSGGESGDIDDFDDIDISIDEDDLLESAKGDVAEDEEEEIFDFDTNLDLDDLDLGIGDDSFGVDFDKKSDGK